MGKKEKYIYSSQYVFVYSSTIAQYKENTNNVTYLFYATKEKNHIYILRGSNAIQNVRIQIGQIEMNNLLPVQSGSYLFIDISEAIKSLSAVADVAIKIYTSGPTISLTYRLVPMVGYNYDNLAQTLSLAQANFCDLSKLANCDYDRYGSDSYVSPPTKIIVPLENGSRKFSAVNYLKIPCYNNYHGTGNVLIEQGGTTIAVATNDTYNMLTFDLNYLQGLFNVKLRIRGLINNKLILEDFNPAKKYVAVRWAYPYTNTVKLSAQGTSAPSYLSAIQFAVTFFELAEYEEEQQVESLESTGSEMPYIIKSERRCKLRMTNLNAYDYIYYAQILKSESIEILFDTNLTESNYQPVKLEKSKVTLPTNGTQLYNLEFNVIISEYD